MTMPPKSSWTRRFVAGATLLFAAAAGAQPPSLREVARIELPGVHGRIDHMAIDADGQRLFIAALGADEVEVVDLKAGKRVAQLKGLREPQGVVYLPSMRRLFVAAGESGEVVAFEGDRRVGAATGLPDADNMRFSAQTGRLVVGYDSGLAVLDPATLAVVERIALPGHPEAFELAEHGPEIYVNVPDVGHVVIVDRRTGKMTGDWPIEPEAANFPMVLDETAHRLYVGTRRPAKLLAIDTATGRRVATLPLCSDVDDLFLDAAQARLLAVCGEGAVDVFSTRDPGEHPAQQQSTAGGARTGLFVPSTRRLFVAAPARVLGHAQVIEYQVP